MGRGRKATEQKQRVAVVGGNFAGLRAMRQLPRELAVTVFDPSMWFEWLPNIHELVSGQRRADQLRLSRGTLVHRAGHAFMQSAVAQIDPARGHLTTPDGSIQPFDACVVAVGGVHATYGVPGADANAMPFKSVADCAAIGRRLSELAAHPGPLAVVVVGGGLEGVEAAGEILRSQRGRAELRLHVVEGSERMLPESSPRVDRQLRELCGHLPVTLHTGTRVTRVDPDAVQLGDGTRIETGLTIWTGGAAPHPLLARSGLAEPGKWAPVRDTLQSTHYDNVFVVGDAAALPKPLAKQAGHALDMGAHAGANVVRLLRGQKLEPFRPTPRPVLVSFGDMDGFAVAGPIALHGRPVNVTKELIYQAGLAMLDRGAGALWRTGARLRSAV